MKTAHDIDTLFEAGAHFGYTRARRHPSADSYIFATKDQTDIFDLEETHKRLEAACAFVSGLAQKGAMLLFVGGKNEIQSTLRFSAERCGMPFSSSRWIGGTLTNFKNIRKRIDRLENLMKERDDGTLDKYTKKERLLIDREIEELNARFGGLINLKDLPAALFVVDTRHEDTAVREANQLGIPVVGLASSDCDFSLAQFPVPANDTSVRSVKLVCDAISDAYLDGKRALASAPKA